MDALKKNMSRIKSLRNSIGDLNTYGFPADYSLYQPYLYHYKKKKILLVSKALEFPSI